MNIYLSRQDEEFVKEKVKSGFYDFPSDVIREALQLLREQDQLRQLRLENLRKEVMLGVEQMRAGNYKTYNSAEELEELFEEIKRKGMAELERRKNLKK